MSPYLLIMKTKDRFWWFTKHSIWVEISHDHQMLSQVSSGVVTGVCSQASWSLNVVVVHRLSRCVTVMEEDHNHPLKDSALTLPPL